MQLELLLFAHFQLLLQSALVGFQLIEHGTAADQLLILISPLGGTAGGQPVVEGVAVRLGGSRGGGVLQADALQIVAGIFEGLFQ